jgi:hypothetical protein
MIDIRNYTISKLAEMALKKPDDFGYWGYEDMFKTWGFAGHDQSRDSNIMEKSNFKVITGDLMNQYPNDFRIETFAHWAVGSVDRLICRILIDETKGCDEDNITESFKASMNWHNRINDYPIADEDYYYEKLQDEAIDCIKNMEDYLLLVTNTEEDGWAEKIYYTLTNDLNFEFDVDAEQYPNDNKILEAVLKSGLCNPDRWGEWYEWCDEQGFDRPIFPAKENPKQLKLFEEI